MQNTYRPYFVMSSGWIIWSNQSLFVLYLRSSTFDHSNYINICGELTPNFAMQQQLKNVAFLDQDQVLL